MPRGAPRVPAHPGALAYAEGLPEPAPVETVADDEAIEPHGH